MMASTTPYLWYRWGPFALLAQFLIIFAIALYVMDQSVAEGRRRSGMWMLLLILSLLTNLYLFVMVIGIWAASLLQLAASGRIAPGRVGRDAVVTVGVIGLVMLMTGILSADLSSASGGGFGYLAINLAGPFVPQLTGLFPGLETYRTGSNYEGFAYLGFGVLLLLLLTGRAAWRWIKLHAAAHWVLIGLLTGYLLFALSNRIYLGSRVLVEIPLPDSLLQLLGTFRSSGRFFWPVGYMLTAVGLLLLLRSYRPKVALSVLSMVCILQLIENQPLRQAVARSAAREGGNVADRNRIAGLVQQARAVKVFPSWYCTEQEIAERRIAFARRAALQSVDMDIQLAAARANRPINSVYNARLSADCDAERLDQHAPLRPGTIYFYLTDFSPAAAQLGARDGAKICGQVERARYCFDPGD